MGSGCQWEWIRKWWYLSTQSYILPLMIFGLPRALLAAGDLLQRTNQIGTTNCIAYSKSLRSRCQMNILTIINRDWLVFPFRDCCESLQLLFYNPSKWRPIDRLLRCKSHISTSNYHGNSSAFSLILNCKQVQKNIKRWFVFLPEPKVTNSTNTWSHWIDLTSQLAHIIPLLRSRY
jgi:hypothetical protein